MAGSQNIGEASDNPVAINVTAMVDVIFCLCLFFMCSFQFKQLEGKIETWLPKDTGINPGLTEKIILEEIRIVLQREPLSGATVRRVGNRAPAADDAGLLRVVLAMTADYHKLGKKDFPVLIEAGRDVPWKDVVHVMDLLKKEHLEKIEFTAPPAAPRGPSGSPG
ncbi:MAG TPA: biopolymer transporter ExbD [Planctomycetota bacterium]|nr:biopolymer transporter ExbD [Planctomycetota bacterium]